MYPVPRDAASVILLRPHPDASRGGYEVFLLRRQRKSSFMPSAFVFPGGVAEASDAGDLRVTAARELFEEAGVLVATPPVAPGACAALRQALATSGALGDGLAFAAEAFRPWSYWVTPSIEPKRFAARFYVGVLPDGQEPAFDTVETVDQIWVTAAEALVRAKELALPPPQVRTFWELSRLPSIDDVLAEADRRATEIVPIMPRVAPAAGGAGGICLLLPWDPEYATAGQGDAHEMEHPPRWATGRSRFRLEDQTWHHVAAPISPSAAS
jgi:8-oxo-dGTP pyrophosphatase MutT (NUDIX family)